MCAPDAVRSEARSAFTRVFDALRRIRGPGFFFKNRGPGSAAHHFMLRYARDTEEC